MLTTARLVDQLYLMLTTATLVDQLYLMLATTLINQLYLMSRALVYKLSLVLSHSSLVNQLNLMLSTRTLIDQLYLMLAPCLTNQLDLVLPSALIDQLYLLHLAWYHVQLLCMNHCTIANTGGGSHARLQVRQGNRDDLLVRGGVVWLGHHQPCQQRGVRGTPRWGSKVGRQ